MSEIRLAFRTLVKRPGPTMVVVLTLAIAIAASTVIYSAIDVVRHFIPAVSRDLVYAAATDTRAAQPGSDGRSVVMRTQVSIPDLADWSARNSTFEQFAGFSLGSANLTGTDIPIRVTAIHATSNLPDLWGFTPTLGRAFRLEDGSPGARGVVLLSQRFWRRQFSSDARVLGQSVMLDGTPHTIRMMLAQGTRPVAAGSLVGLIAAIAIASILATAVPELDARDPASYLAVILTIGLFAAVASYLPARRAAAIDPAHTLKAE